MIIIKAWARRFYHSKAWLNIRKLALIRDAYLCRRCEQPAYIVHHTIELTPDNVNDPSIALNLDLLECVCKSCHDDEHEFAEKRATVKGLRFDENGDIINIKTKEVIE